MANTRENPYVGPRAFTLKDKEKLAGRDQDITALYRLLIAERIVLLFSPSGAGKTSLVQAGLIPRMKDKGFDVLPVIRVGQGIPAGMEDIAGLNRYALSVVESLEKDENPSTDERIRVEKLASLRLKEYFSQRLQSGAPAEDEEADFRGKSHKSLLVFDQFEEILTIAPGDREEKREFFSQLGEALERRDCWALFVAREDFVAALDPYLRFIPTRLANTFRLDLLEFDDAQQAITKPASLAEVEFTDDAVKKLINDLRSVRVQRPDGSWEPEAQLGRYVEPVQLQVVCYRLWNKIGEAKQITEKQVESLGDVSEALAGFYADQVAEVAGLVKVPEKEIRAWFDNALITPNGIRSQVMLSEGQSGGLSNEAILELERSYLIRGEMRRGVRWFELAHDRLIKPVRKSNNEWFAKNLSTLQRQAMLWEAQGHSDNLLLRDQALAEAEKWAESQHLTPAEVEFLKSCQDLRNSLQAEAAQKEAEAQRQKAEELGKLNDQLEKSNRGLRVRNIIAFALLGIAAVAIVVAVLQSMVATQNAEKAQDYALIAQSNEYMALENLSVAEEASKEAIEQKKIAEQKAKEAEQQKAAAQAAEADARLQLQISLSSSLAARASTLVDKNPPLATLLSLESLNFASQTNTYQPVAEQNLRDLLGNNLGYALSGHANPLSHILFTPDEGLLITADISVDDVRVWNLNAIDPASASAKLPLGPFRDKPISAIAISPDNRLLAAGSRAGTFRGPAGVVYLWKVSGNAINLAPDEIIVDPDGGEVSALAFGKRGDKYWLAAGMSNGKVALVDVSPNVTEFSVIQLVHGITRLNALAFSPDGHWLSGGSEENQVRIWDVDAPTRGPAAHSQDGPVRMLAYSPSGAYLVGAGDTKEIYVYNVKIRENRPFTLARDLSNVKAIAFNPADPRLVAVGYANGAIKIWNIASNSNRPVSEIDAQSEINHLAFSPDGLWMASAAKDMSVRLWDMSNFENGPAVRSKVFKVFIGEISALSFSSNGRWLAVGTSDHEVQMWDFRLGYGSMDPISFGKGDDVYRNALFSPDGKWMAVRKKEKDDSITLLLWNTDEFMGGNRQPQLELRKMAALGFGPSAFSPDSKTLALGFLEGGVAQVRLYNLDDPKAAPRSLPTDAGGFVFVGFSPSAAHRLVACDAQGNIRIWDAANLDSEPIRQKFSMAGLDRRQMSFSFSPQGRWLAGVAQYGTTDASIILLDLNRPESAPLTYPGAEGGADGYAFSQDERWFAVGNFRTFDQKSNTTVNGQSYIWDLSAPNPAPQLLDGHNGYVNTLAFDPVSNLLATGDDAGNIRLWDVTGARPLLLVLHFTEDGIEEVAFSHNGRWLAAGSADGTAGLWEINPKKSMEEEIIKGLYPLNGHQGPIWNLTFSPNDQWLATGSADRTIRLWNIKNRRSDPIILRGFTGEIDYLEFESQARFLVSNTNLAESQVWRLGPNDLRALACQAANRNLTEGEWLQYLPEGLRRSATCPELPLP